MPLLHAYKHYVTELSRSQALPGAPLLRYPSTSRVKGAALPSPSLRV